MTTFDTYHTRADLMQFPAFARLDTDTSGNPIVWENHYRCPDCEDQLPDDEPTTDSVDWIDTWSCKCDDECPNCGLSVSPYHSDWIGPDSQDLREFWECLSEAGGASQPQPAVIEEARRQKRSDEMSSEDRENADWQGGYDCMVDLARILLDKIEGLEADLEDAVETAYHRGAVEWAESNYPKIVARILK